MIFLVKDKKKQLCLFVMWAFWCGYISNQNGLEVVEYSALFETEDYNRILYEVSDVKLYCGCTQGIFYGNLSSTTTKQRLYN
jgi:hypothetical protein